MKRISKLTHKHRFSHDVKWQVFNHFHGSSTLTRCLLSATVVQSRWGWFGSPKGHQKVERDHLKKLKAHEDQLREDAEMSTKLDLAAKIGLVKRIDTYNGIPYNLPPHIAAGIMTVVGMIAVGAIIILIL